MSNPTVSTFLDTRSNRKKNGKYPLKLRVTVSEHQNRSRGIGFDFTEQEYEKLMKNITKAPWKDIWNLINAKINKGERIVEELMPYFTFEEFWERYFHKKTFEVAIDKTSLMYVTRKVCENYVKKDQYPMSVKVKDSVQSILKYAEAENIPMRSITPKFCREYEAYMYEKSVKKTRNGAGINMRHIRILFNQAIAMNLIPRTWYPFKREAGELSEFPDPYVIPNERKVKEYLSEDELVTMFRTTEFATHAQKRSHDAWLISFYCNGCNAADFLEFKYRDIQGDFIVFYREKVKNATRGDKKPVKVYLSLELRSLIKEIGNPAKPDNYIFKCYEPGMTVAGKYKARKEFVAKVSKSLKNLAGNLGFEKTLRLGNARHSLANVLKKNGVDREMLKDLFGHTSIITADNYFGEFDEEQQAEVAKNFISIANIERRLKHNRDNGKTKVNP
jgi:site-specific recombinase XerD